MKQLLFAFMTLLLVSVTSIVSYGSDDGPTENPYTENQVVTDNVIDNDYLVLTNTGVTTIVNDVGKVSTIPGAILPGKYKLISYPISSGKYRWLHYNSRYAKLDKPVFKTHIRQCPYRE